MTTETKPDLAWMKPKGAKKALIVRNVQTAIENRALIELTYPGHRIFVAGEPITRDTIGVAIMFRWKPRKSGDFAWMNDVLLKALHQGRKPEWVD